VTRGKLFVFNEPKSAEVEAEFNAWYDGQHVPEILEHVPAITGAKRYRLAAGQDNRLPGVPRYLSVYDIDTEVVTDAVVQLGQAVRDGKVIMTDTIRSEPSSTVVVYEEI